MVHRTRQWSPSLLRVGTTAPIGQTDVCALHHVQVSPLSKTHKHDNDRWIVVSRRANATNARAGDNPAIPIGWNNREMRWWASQLRAVRLCLMFSRPHPTLGSLMFHTRRMSPNVCRTLGSKIYKERRFSTNHNTSNTDTQTNTSWSVPRFLRSPSSGPMCQTDWWQHWGGVIGDGHGHGGLLLSPIQPNSQTAIENPAGSRPEPVIRCCGRISLSRWVLIAGL